MKKLTKTERLDALNNGFYRCGYVEIENVEAFITDPTRLTDQLTEAFANSIREANKLLKVTETRSKDFIDSEGVYYDFKGKTYQYGQFLIHIYLSTQGKNAGASISLLA